MSSSSRSVDHDELRRRLSDLRVRVMPVRRRLVRDVATFLVLGDKLRRARHDNPDTDDEPRFIEIPIDNLPSSISLSPLNLPIPTTAQPPPTEPPSDPPESTQLPDPMPQARAAWERAAAREFRAGDHGPVELPSDLPLPTPSDASRVFLASNYRSSRSLSPVDRGFLARKTATELLTGAIERVTRWQDVVAILPMFVVTNSSGKQRVIFDARALNRLLRESRGSVRYESVRDALVDAAVCTKLDVASAFRHVAVAEQQRGYLCFEVEGRLYRYRTLPFGVSWSPALFYNALAPAIARIRKSLPPGARIVWYVDDLLIVAPSVAALDTATANTINTLLDTGWSVSPEKTYPHAYRSITFLGLTVDYTDGRPRISVPASKAARIREDALALASGAVIRVHHLLRLAGRLEFVRLVLPQVGFLRRGIDAAVADASRALHACIPITAGSRLHTDLITIAHAAETFPGKYLTVDDDTERPQLGVVYADASAYGWGALHLHPDAPFVRIPDPVTDSDPDLRGWTTGALFTPRERAMSSGAREVRAVVDAIEKLDLRGGDVVWHSDATVAVAAISRWRSKSDDIVDILRQLWDLIAARDLRVSVHHVLRDAELMPAADWLSRRGWRDRQAEWAFDPSDAGTVCRALGVPAGHRPTADLFASERNALVRPYCGRWAEPGCIGDAFFVDWSSSPGRLWWAFPPFSQLSRLSHRLLSYIRQAHRLSTLASESPHAGRRRPTWSLILIYPVLPVEPTFLSDLLPHAVRDVLVHAANASSPHSVVPAAAIATASKRPAVPRLRLRAGDRPAPGPPPWPLRAALFHV